MEFMYLVFFHMPGEGHRRQLGSLLLCSRDVFQVLINSLCVDSEVTWSSCDEYLFVTRFVVSVHSTLRSNGWKHNTASWCPLAFVRILTGWGGKS